MFLQRNQFLYNITLKSNSLAKYSDMIQLFIGVIFRWVLGIFRLQRQEVLFLFIIFIYFVYNIMPVGFKTVMTKFDKRIIAT